MELVARGCSKDWGPSRASVCPCRIWHCSQEAHKREIKAGLCKHSASEDEGEQVLTGACRQLCAGGTVSRASTRCFVGGGSQKGMVSFVLF